MGIEVIYTGHKAARFYAVAAAIYALILADTAPDCQASGSPEVLHQKVILFH